MGEEELVQIVHGEWRKSEKNRLAPKAAIQHALDARPPFSSRGPIIANAKPGYDSLLSAERSPISSSEKKCNRDVHVVRDVACRFKIVIFRLFGCAKRIRYYWYMLCVPLEASLKAGLCPQ